MGAYDDPKVALPIMGQAAKSIEAFYRSMTAAGNQRLQSINQAQAAAERAVSRTRKFEKDTYGGSVAQSQIAKNKISGLEKGTSDIFKGDQSRANLEKMRDNFHEAINKAGGQDASQSEIMEITGEYEQKIINYKQSLEVFAVGFEKYRELIEIEGNADNAIMEGLNPEMIGIYERMNDPNATGEIGIVEDPGGSGDFIVADFTRDSNGKIVVNGPTTTTSAAGVTSTTGTVPANLSKFKRDLGYTGDLKTLNDLEYFQQVTGVDKIEAKKFVDQYLTNNLNTGSSSIAQITQVPVMVKNQQGTLVQASTPAGGGNTPSKKFKEKITLNDKEMRQFLTTQKGQDLKNAVFGGDDIETVYRSTYVLDPATNTYVPPKDAQGNVLTAEQATNQIIFDLYK